MNKGLYIFLFFLPLCLFSQSYNGYTTAAGVRVGGGVGMSVQQRLTAKTTVEGIAQRKLAENSPTTVTALVRRHKALHGNGAINAYMGVGAHRTWTSAEDFYGIDGVIGLEGTLFYLNTSLDYRPLWNVNADDKAYHGQLGLTVRYVIKQTPYKKKKKKNNEEYFNLPPQTKWT